jgi:hypothetical protein
MPYFHKTQYQQGFQKNRGPFTASYFKIYGIMCCIVLKYVYVCIVIGNKQVIPE